MSNWFEATASDYPCTAGYGGWTPYDARYRAESLEDAQKWARAEKKRGAKVKVLKVEEVELD